MRSFKQRVITATILTMAPLCALPAQIYQVPGVGWEGRGADLVVRNLDSDPRPEMLVMAYDFDISGSTFRYRMGRNLSIQGEASAWSEPIIVPGVGPYAQGAGMAIAAIDNVPRWDLILMANYHPSGGNFFRYKVGWNLDTSGRAPVWGNYIQVPGVGWEAQGAAAAVGQIDANPRPDLIFMAYDNPSGGNSFRYRVGMNLNVAGVANWSGPVHIVPGLGWEGQGAGMALVHFDANPRPELVLMAYDNPAGGNSFRYRIGWNLNAAGAATSWTNGPQIPGLGWEGQGAGLAVTCLDPNEQGDWIFMAYDNPPNANSFKYRLLSNFSPRCA